LIALEGVWKEFPAPRGSERPAQRAVDDVSFTVPAGETLCLIGTSGCGKTTTLKMINRLVEPSGGRILINGSDTAASDRIALRRGIGYVIQKIGLLPHRTVAENIALLPRLEGWDASRLRARTDELLDMVGLRGYGGRYPAELSGGQQQRVGVARALALDPPILLMDEPFGALDPITRESLQDEFVRLKEVFKKTIVMVTHDLQEAFKLGDRVALMEQGRMVQIGAESDFRARPASPFVEDFLRAHLAHPTLSAIPALSAVARDARPSDDAPTLPRDATMKQAMDLFFRYPAATTLALVDENGTAVGAVTRESLLQAV